MKKFLNSSGPGILVAAAFIGPGTVTVCTQAGANYGYALLWAMLLSIVATLVLQEMAARLGLITQKGLAKIINEQLTSPAIRVAGLTLILSAIAIGNAAYEAGNISGGVLGFEALDIAWQLDFGGLKLNAWSILIGLMAFGLLYVGNYKFLERYLVALVVLMSIAFLTTAIAIKPDFTAIVKGLVTPNLPKGSLLTLVALIGTTIVPYNLFLHASLVAQKWNGADKLSLVKRDTIVAIIFGGMVSMTIIICAAAINQEVKNGSDLALSLAPIFGNYAKYLIGIGLISAGLTSAITAPLAAAFVVQGCLGWARDMKSWKFRAVWIFILILGILFSSIGYAPVEIIKFAQVANGILLPVIATYLLWMVNKKELLGNYVNSRWQNILAIGIVGITLILGLRSIFKVLGII